MLRAKVLDWGFKVEDLLGFRVYDVGLGVGGAGLTPHRRTELPSQDAATQEV